MLLLEKLPTALLHDLLKYLIFAGGLALLLYLLRQQLQARRLQSRRPQWLDYRREIIWSLVTACLFALGSLLGIFWLSLHGWNQVYRDFTDYSWSYTVASLLLMIVAHDAWFYWTHRLLHRPAWRKLHVLHHRSRTPTPWTAYAFHPGEALVHIAFPILFALLMPLHTLVLLLWSVHMITRNVIGHCGYELFPRWMVNSGWFDWLTTSTHHDLHHQDGRYNFGLYFTWWDRWMGSEHPQYRTRLAQALSLQPEDSGTSLSTVATEQ